MACRILRDENGNVTRVLASNNEPSNLYKAIRSRIGEEEALLDYAATFTPEFKEVIESLSNSGDVSSQLYDENNEVTYQVYNYIMNPETILQQKFYPQDLFFSNSLLIDKNDKTFTNSLWRGQASKPKIDAEGNLILIPSYEELSKDYGKSFTTQKNIAESYGTRYSNNPYLIEIDEDYISENYSLQDEDVEGEKRIINKEPIKIPKEKYNIINPSNKKYENVNTDDLIKMYISNLGLDNSMDELVYSSQVSAIEGINYEPTKILLEVILERLNTDYNGLLYYIGKKNNENIPNDISDFDESMLFFKDNVSTNIVNKATKIYNKNSNNIEFNRTFPDAVEESENIAPTMINAIANRIASQLNVAYSVITQEEAAKMLAEKNQPYNGEKAFFFNGQVYIIADNFTLNNVLHEFSHPLIKAIKKTNPGLFNKLFSEFEKTEEGQQIIRDVEELYPEKDKESEDFKEECLVRALTIKATAIELGKANSSEFVKFIDKLLYHIKQILRKVFGKVKVEKLKETTTLDNLAKMLNSEQFNISADVITELNAEFSRQKDIVDEMTAMTDKLLAESGLNEFYELLKNHQSKFERAEVRDPGLSQIITDNPNDKPFQNTIVDIRPYQSIDDPDVIIRDVATYRNNQIKAFVHNLHMYNKTIVENILPEIERLKTEGDSAIVINRYTSLLEMLKSTNKSFEKIKETFVDENVPVNNGIFKLLNEVIDSSEAGSREIKKQFEVLLPKTLAPLMEGLNQNIINDYNKLIDSLIEKGKDPEKIEKLKKERDSYLRDEEYLARVLTGKEPEPQLLGLSTLVESAISSPDGLIASFAKFVKLAMIDVDNNANKNFSDFLDNVMPAIEKAGIDFNKISGLGQQITYVETKGFVNPETGEFETREVVQFLNPFSGHELALSKIQFKINNAIKEKDDEALKLARQEKLQFMRNYMHQKYKPEVYDVYDVFKDTFTDSKGNVHMVGEIAYERMTNALENIQNGNRILNDELDALELDNKIKTDALISEYKELFSKTTKDGRLKGEVELAITEVLLKYRAERRKYFEYESDLDEDSAPIRRFNEARSKFRARLLTRFDENSDEFRDALLKWDKANTRQVIDPSFYKDKNKITEKLTNILLRISNLSSMNKKEKEKLDKSNEIIKKKLEYIIDQLYAYRDEENHPNGLNVTKEKAEKIKEAQNEIIKLQEQLRKGNGLTRAEEFELQKLTDLENSGALLTDEDYGRMEILESARTYSKIPQGLKKDLKEAYEELNELQSKSSTDYYLSAYNHQVQQYNERLDAAGKIGKVNSFDIFNIDELGVDKSFVDDMCKKDPEFKKWFFKNHVVVLRRDPNTGRYVEKYERLYIWNKITPNDQEKYLRRMNLSGENARNQKHGIGVYGMPALAYYKQNIKPDYLTPDTIDGIPTKDNKGNPLPRLEPGNPYVNKAYTDLKTSSPEVFEVLQKITEQYLKFQEKADRYDRLYLEVPRYEKTSKELTETNKFFSEKGSRVRAAYTRIKNAIQENPEDRDEGFNIDKKWQLIKLDQFEDDEKKIYVTGKTLMKEDQVSRDVITSTLRYMYGVERAAKLKEIHPVAKALQTVLEDPRNQPKDQSKVSLTEWVKNKIPVFANKRGENIRLNAINAMIDRNFYNISQTGFGSDAIVLQKISRLMMSGASFGFFAFDFASGIKNRFGQQVQQTIELAAGTSYDTKSFLKGKIIASKAMMQITGSIYSKGKLPYYVQLVNAFDPNQGTFAEKMPQYITRTIYKDALDPRNVTMSPRKFMEIEATLEFFFGVMENTKVEQTINGTTTEIPYHEAFELVDDKLTLKEGIDKKWDIGGDNYKRKRLFIQEKQNILNGVYSIFDQPEGNRYLFYRLFMFLRKFFITGFLSRFGYSGSIFSPRMRRNEAIESLDMGYWLQFARSLAKLCRTMGEHHHYMLPQESRAMRKALMEMAVLTILSIVMPWILGWDDDDDDKYEKLRKKQGEPLGSENFHLGGWLANHLLYQTMSVASENSQYYKLGFYSDMLSNFNLANGPTIETYGKIIDSAIDWVQDDPGAFYKRDTGPYPWQKAESAKVVNFLAKAISLNGKNIDPAKAIQDFISIENIH